MGSGPRHGVWAESFVSVVFGIYLFIFIHIVTTLNRARH